MPFLHPTTSVKALKWNLLIIIIIIIIIIITLGNHDPEEV